MQAMPSSTTTSISQMSGSYPQGSNGTPSLTVADAPHVDEWRQWFGAPPRPIDTNPYDAYRQSTFAMPEAYKGNSPYMQTVLIQLILDEDLWTVNYALPFRRDESRIEITWDVIEFSNSLLNVVPEEGTSRLVTQQMSAKQDYMQRFGLGFLLEHGFMRTERGRMSYTMHLKQIKNAVLETAYYQVLEAYLRCKNHSQVWAMRYGRGMSQQTRKLAQDNEVEEFGLIQKVEHGFDLLHTRLKRAMTTRNGVEPDMWILNEGVKLYLTNVRRENFVSFLNGADAAGVFKSGLDGQRSKAIDTKNGCMIFETKSLEMPGEAEPINVMLRNRTIGEFYTMLPHLDIDASYTSAQRSVTLFDAKKDGFTKITLAEALEACPRFNRDGALNFDDVSPSACDGDPFLYETVSGRKMPVQYLGDMKQEFLKDRAIMDFVASALNAFEPQRKLEMRHALEDGLRLISEIEDIPSTKTDSQTNYFVWIYNIYGAATPTYDIATGLVDLPKQSDMNADDWNGKNPKFMPCGYSTFAGLQIIAKTSNAPLYENMQNRASAFVRAVTDLYSRLSLTCQGNIFCDPAFQPSYLPKADGRNTLVSNVITMPQPPLILKRTQGADGFMPSITINKDLYPDDITAANFMTMLSTQAPRLHRYFVEAFEPDGKLKVDYAVAFTGRENGPRLSKLESVFCAILSKVTRGRDGSVPSLSDVASFNETTDGVFFAGENRASAEEIGVCQDFSNTLINALKRAGLDAGTDGMRELVFKIAELMVLLRFGPIQLSLQSILGLFYGMSFARNFKTMVQYAFCANLTLIDYLKQLNAGKENPNIRTMLAQKLSQIEPKLLASASSDFSQMIQLPDFLLSLDGQQTFDTSNIVLPLAGSQAMMQYFETADDVKKKLTVANNGTYSDLNQPITDAAWTSTNRSARYTHAAFGLEHSTLATRPRFASAPFDRSRDRLYEDYNPERENNVNSRFIRREDYAKRRRANNDNNNVGWSMGFGSNDGEDGRTESRAVHFGEGSSLTFSYNFVDRYRTRVNVESDILIRCAMTCFLGCSVTRPVLRNFIEKNVVLPFSFVLVRPYIEFRMAAGILAKAGRETGETLIGPHNFMLGDDAVRKTHYGNFTINMRAIVYNDRNVHIQNDMAFDRYVRGMDCTFVTTKAEHDAYVQSGQGGKSMYSILEPYESAEYIMRNNPIDVSGAFSGMEASNLEEQTMYASAKWYNNYFQWQNDNVADPNEPMFYSGSRNNSVCYLGYTGLYNVVSHQNDCVIPPTGHLGSVYQGVVKVWNGGSRQYEQMNYSNTYGGAGQMNQRVILT